MCATCGCSDHAHGHEHEHGHDHDHPPHDQGNPHPPEGGDPPEGSVRARIVEVETALLAKNDAVARDNRAHFAAHGVAALNLMSSPGSGKTTLLVRTLERLRGRVPLAVIEGDQETDLDAERIRATGVPSVQITTGKACHLDAAMVARGFASLHGLEAGLLFVENVGNLVCPAAFDLGETRRVVLASVTEGDDKPLKYPYMFASADVVLLTKIDLLPHVDFDARAFEERLARVRPAASTIRVSAKTGEGMDAWLAWLDGVRVTAAESHRHAE